MEGSRVERLEHKSDGRSADSIPRPNRRSRLGVRGKLFVVSLFLISLARIVSGTFLEPALRSWLLGRIEDDLLHRARLAAHAVSRFGVGSRPDGLDTLADRLGVEGDVRVSIVQEDGRLVGDSLVSTEQLDRVDDHGDRPEIRQAIAHGKGVSRRHSRTLKTDMMYVAVRVSGAGNVVILRVAKPLTDVAQAVSRLRWLLLVGGFLGLGAAVLMSVFAAHLLSRDLRDLAEKARALARGTGVERLRARTGDEVGRLAGSYNRIADELRYRVGALAQERDRLTTVLETMNEALLACDADERLTLVNPAACELFGLPEVHLELPVVDLIRVPELIALIRHASDASAQDEFLVSHPQPRRVYARANPLRNGGAVVVVHDVTEQRRLERIRQDFVANVSHELRTPVSVIQANVETLRDGAIDDPALAQKFLQALSRHADRLTQLVTDVLELSRIEAGKVPLKPESVLLGDAVRWAVDMVESSKRVKAHKLNVMVDAGLHVHADRQALREVLLNVIGNAAKYTPEGGSIDIVGVVEGDRIVVEVSDDGPGIAEHHRARIFERFYRVDEGRSRDIGGTGLGLAIAKHLVEAMSGEIGVAANDPHGTVFRVQLPVGAPTDSE